MKKLAILTIGILLFGLTVVPSQAAFSSLYVFGDALSTTTNNTSGLTQYYYGKRFSNGRVWVEVLAQRQGLAIYNNWSYFDCNSGNLVANVNKFSIAPKDATNALCVIWVNNSDMYDEALNGNTKLSEWTAAINQSQTYHLQAIINLYAQGVRTFVMPNAVDVSRVPEFDAYAQTNFIRQECIAYNVAFSNTLNQARALCPNITIFSPNFFALLDNVLASPANYGLTNALINYGQGNVSIDAMDALYPTCNTNGLGANYIFWDYLDPSAKLHEVMADVAQQIISPVQISKLTPLNNGSNRLDVVNYPAGLAGFVDGSTNLPNWATVQNITSTNIADSFFAPTNGSLQFIPNVNINPIGGSGSNGVPVIVTAQFYRLHFPCSWSWP
jgi:phospholipase/lecithinase/hemolysin